MTQDKRDNLESLYRQAGDAEPDRRTDAAILDQARQSAKQPRRRAMPHLGPWSIGIAAAASVVLAVGLVFRLGLERGPVEPEVQQYRMQESLDDAAQPARPAAPVAGASMKSESAAEPRPADETAGGSGSADADRVESDASRQRNQAEAEDTEERAMSREEIRQSTPVQLDEAEKLSPEARLERIRILVEEGRKDEAREALREFRDDYPSAVIPEEIREALAAEPG